MNNFEYRKNIPQYWFNKSSDLRAAAGVVWHGMHSEQSNLIIEELNLGKGFDLQVATYPVFPMLCGLSLELMYKAICVAKKIDFKKFEKTHILVDLGKLAGVQLSEKEQGLLRIYTESVIWNGKYPVPTDRMKDSFAGLSALRRQYLFDKVKDSEFEFIKPNGALNWNSFNLLWLEGSRLYKKYDLLD